MSEEPKPLSKREQRKIDLARRLEAGRISQQEYDFQMRRMTRRGISPESRRRQNEKKDRRRALEGKSFPKDWRPGDKKSS